MKAFGVLLGGAIALGSGGLKHWSERDWRDFNALMVTYEASPRDVRHYGPHAAAHCLEERTGVKVPKAFAAMTMEAIFIDMKLHKDEASVSDAQIARLFKPYADALAADAATMTEAEVTALTDGLASIEEDYALEGCVSRTITAWMRDA